METYLVKNSAHHVNSYIGKKERKLDAFLISLIQYAKNRGMIYVPSIANPFSISQYKINHRHLCAKCVNEHLKSKSSTRSFCEMLIRYSQMVRDFLKK